MINYIFPSTTQLGNMAKKKPLAIVQIDNWLKNNIFDQSTVICNYVSLISYIICNYFCMQKIRPGPSEKG